MTEARIEHVNLTVSDVDRSANFFAGLLGWHQRWRGAATNGGETIHLGQAGEGRNYIAFYTDKADHSGQSKGKPLNHVGLLVNDLESAEDAVIAAGLVPFGHGDYAPGRRFYFFDWDGIEFEIVSYSGHPPRQKRSS